MAKVTTKAVFKPYQPDQIQILPLSLDELIDPKHLVRVVRSAVDRMNLSGIINMYPGGGSSSYHPKMMLNVLLYAYARRIYSGRRIAQALRDDITFMWISGRNTPGFRTINQFRSGVLKGAIEELFKSMLQFLIEHQYVSLKEYFLDGSTFCADANKHKMVWKKNSVRYQEGLSEKCQELFKQIDALNAEEDRMYGDRDLEEVGVEATVTEEKMNEQIEVLNKIIDDHAAQDKGKVRKAKTLKNQLEKHRVRNQKYDDQIAIAGTRSGYSRTDPDATGMRMKHDETLPAYNVLIGTENQMILSYSVHQTPSDMTAFPEHLEQIEQHTGQKPTVIVADAGFGSEQSYELLEEKDIKNYVKYNTFHHEQTRKHKENRFHKDNFHYDVSTDSYVCPNDQQLVFETIVERVNKKTGYRSMLKQYRCLNCQQCPFAEACKQSSDANRTIQVNEKLERFKQQARDNLHSEEGIRLRKQRGHDVESVFGDLKRNQLFHRFHLRGKQKVKSEFAILAISHNLRKIHLLELQKAS